MIASVALTERATPGQALVQVEFVKFAAESNNAVEPDGGMSSMKLTFKRPVETPERFTVTDVVPPAPLKLYAASTFRARVD